MGPAMTTKLEKPLKRELPISGQPHVLTIDPLGFKLVRNIPVMGDEGEDYGSHAEIRYENCRVPQANLRDLHRVVRDFHATLEPGCG